MDKSSVRRTRRSGERHGRRDADFGGNSHFRRWRRSIAGVWLFAILGGAAVQASGRVVINEFMADNESGIEDEDGDRSDWLELWNTGSESVDLAGWYLTDTAGDTAGGYRFSSFLLAAGERRVIFASGKDRSGPREWHTNFKLGKEGEYLGLVRADGRTVEHAYTPAFPAQHEDISYGLPEDRERPDFLRVPTPGTANSGPLLGVLGPVHFSHERGFYDAPFVLHLECDDPAATILFTRNGSRPVPGVASVYREPLVIDRTEAVRAVAVRPGYRGSGVATHTYIFVTKVAHQSPDGEPPPGWPESWGRNRVHYGMNPQVVEDPRYAALLPEALMAIPSYSLVMNLEDLFDPYQGIYANAREGGREWERPASVELLNPDGSPGFQVDCGVRIRGGFSRSPGNPKHAFRLFFRRDYGPGKLRFPVFGDAGAQEFDHLDLRTTQNYSWSFQGSRDAVFLRDMFSRDTQLAMGHPGARGYFCHLYINGHYWGLYNTCERPEASFGATYLGGKPDDYDVIKIVGRNRSRESALYDIFATDGTLRAWRRLWELAKSGFEDPATYFAALGCHADGTPNPDLPALLDPVNLIDYMLVIFYAGNLDSPVSRFMGNRRPNNFFALRSRSDTEGFRFVIWDAEHTLLDPNIDRTGPYPAGRHFSQSNPQWLWQQCLENPEFRMLAADRIHRHFGPHGVFSTNAVLRRFLKRAREIEVAVIAESARWGDAGNYRRFRWGNSNRGEVLNRDDHWRPAVNRITYGFFPNRREIVLDQLWSHGLVPGVSPPAFNHPGGAVAPGFALSLTHAEGEVYYTLDGSDPRAVGGNPSPTAVPYRKPIPITGRLTVKSRAFKNREWSALTEAQFSSTAPPRR